MPAEALLVVLYTRLRANGADWEATCVVQDACKDLFRGEATCDSKQRAAALAKQRAMEIAKAAHAAHAAMPFTAVTESP